MPVYIFAWIGAFGYGLTNIVGKLMSKYSIRNPWLFNFLMSLLTCLLTVPITLFNHASLPSSWINISFASLCYALYFILFTLALYRLDISVISPLYNFRAAFSVLFGAVILGEKLIIQQFILVGVIFVAGFFVSLDEKFKARSFFRSGILLALTAMLFLALTAVFVNKAIAQNGYWTVNLWQSIMVALIMLFTFNLFKTDLFRLQRKQIIVVAIAASSFVIAELAANKAYAENVGISSVIISLPFSMILAFLLSIFAPKLLEKHTHKVYAIRFAAAAVMIISALKLSG